MFELIGKGVVFIGTSIYSIVLAGLNWQVATVKKSIPIVVEFTKSTLKRIEEEVKKEVEPDNSYNAEQSRLSKLQKDADKAAGITRRSVAELQAKAASDRKKREDLARFAEMIYQNQTKSTNIMANENDINLVSNAIIFLKSKNAQPDTRIVVKGESFRYSELLELGKQMGIVS